MENIEKSKYFALLEEYETSYKLLKLGFGELQNINLDNDFYFLPFQLLSQGLERFMKAYICTAYYVKNNVLPDYRFLMDLGHNLESILNVILDDYYVISDGTQFKRDIDFLRKDEDLKSLIYLLSEFGKKSRYYNFDIITGNPKLGVDVRKLWEKFEDRVVKKNSLK